jgi:CBS domain-containing protein
VGGRTTYGPHSSGGHAGMGLIVRDWDWRRYQRAVLIAPEISASVGCPDVQARDIAEPFPLVTVDTPAVEAAGLLAERRLPGLIVLDRSGRPHAILPGSQVLRFMIPGYIQDDLSLAHVLDERHADRLSEALRGKTVEQLLPARRDELPVVAADATAVEIAAVMARWRSPVVAVVGGGRLLGAVTVSRLLGLLLERPPESPA